VKRKSLKTQPNDESTKNVMRLIEKAKHQRMPIEKIIAEVLGVTLLSETKPTKDSLQTNDLSSNPLSP